MEKKYEVDQILINMVGYTFIVESLLRLVIQQKKETIKFSFSKKKIEEKELTMVRFGVNHS